MVFSERHGEQGSDARPGLAIVSDHVTPYRVHFHSRVAREIPELRLLSVFIAQEGGFTWDLELPASTRPVLVAGGGDASLSPSLRGAWKGLEILRMLRRERVAAAVVHGYNRASFLTVLLLGRAFGVRVLLSADSNVRGDAPRGRLRAALKRRLVPWVLSRCDAVLPMGRLGQAYVKRYGADPARCFLMPYEPDYSAVAQAEAGAVDAFRARHGVPRGRRLVLHAGRLAQVKRVDLLLDAFVRLAPDRADWDLAIAGTGPLEGELRARVPGALASRVHWLGFLPPSELCLAYHASDVFAIASDYEPWAVVVNEAVAAGLVVVASDVVGAAAELVEDGVSGRIFRAGDAGSLLAALREATLAERHAAMRSEVPARLAAWRHKADPVAGLRSALAAVGVLRG